MSDTSQGLGASDRASIDKYISPFFTNSAVLKRGQQINAYRKKIEEDLDNIIASTPEKMRRKIWDYALITDDDMSEREFWNHQIRQTAYFDCAIVILDEMEQGDSSAREEYNLLLEEMRYNSLVIDAIVNSSRGEGCAA